MLNHYWFVLGILRLSRIPGGNMFGHAPMPSMVHSKPKLLIKAKAKRRLAIWMSLKVFPSFGCRSFWVTKALSIQKTRGFLQQGSFQGLFISSIATSGLQSNKHQLKQKHVSQECSLLNLRSSWNHHRWCHRPFAIVGTTTISQSLLASTSGNAEMGADNRFTDVTLVAVAGSLVWSRLKRKSIQTDLWYPMWEPVILRLNGTVATLTQAHVILYQSARKEVQKNWQDLVI